MCDLFLPAPISTCFLPAFDTHLHIHCDLIPHCQFWFQVQGCNIYKKYIYFVLNLYTFSNLMIHLFLAMQELSSMSTNKAFMVRHTSSAMFSTTLTRKKSVLTGIRLILNKWLQFSSEFTTEHRTKKIGSILHTISLPFLVKK